MSEEIIKIEHVSKEYRLGMIGGTTLRDELQRKSAKLRGREDPTRKVTDTSAGNAGERFLALDDINLTIKKGERVGIIGHNGAGKSTLLKLLSRITAPSRGSIELNGRIASMLEVGTGFHGELSGRENIYMNGAILGMSKAEIDSKMEDIIEFSECRQFIDTPVKRYSSGMYVKLAFSVAAHLDSEIMIMDEVLAVGDMQFQKKSLGKMENVSKADGRTILYVSHNMRTIQQLCNRCVVLDKGKIIYDGNVNEGINRYIGNYKPFVSEVIVDGSLRENRLESMVYFRKVQVLLNDGCLKFGNTLSFKLYLDNDDVIERNVYVRACIDNPMSETITMSQTQFPIEIKAGSKSFCKQFEFDISNVVPGNYNISFVAYELIKGKVFNLDILRNIIPISIIADEKFNNGLGWNTKWWGNISNGFLEVKK